VWINTENPAVSNEASENLTGAISELINGSSIEDLNNLSSTTVGGKFIIKKPKNPLK